MIKYSQIPVEYQRIEYLESDGSPYIDTGYLPSLTSKIRVKFSPLLANATGYFGSRKDPYRFCCTTFDAGTKVAFAITNNSWPSDRVTISYGNVYDCIAENGKYSINGTEYASEIIGAWDNDTTFLLSAINAYGVRVETSARYYMFQAWENGVLVRNCVPCRRKSDSVLGMYDTVTGVFLTNAGIGSFIAGQDVDNSDLVVRSYVTDNNGVVSEVKKVYLGNQLIFENE